VTPLSASLPAAPSAEHFAPIPGSPSRDESLDALNAMSGTVTSFYIRLLYLVMALATLAVLFLYFQYPDNGNRQFMLFYGGVVYLVGMLALVNQVARTRRRQHVSSHRPDLMNQFRSKVQVNVHTSPEIHFIDDAALDRAERHLDAGGSFDEACERMHPGYAVLDPHVKRLVQTALRASLDKRRPRG
jgi:hypothetical protein